MIVTTQMNVEQIVGMAMSGGTVMTGVTTRTVSVKEVTKEASRMVLLVTKDAGRVRDELDKTFCRQGHYVVLIAVTV